MTKKTVSTNKKAPKRNTKRVAREFTQRIDFTEYFKNNPGSRPKKK